MNTTSPTLDRDDFTPDEIIYRHERQARAKKLHRWAIGTGAVAVAGAAVVVGLLGTSSNHGASTPGAPAGTSTSSTTPSHPSAPSANPAVPSRPDSGTSANPAVPSSPGAAG
ncbi:MAG: hypothetical protein JO016_03680 [Actinobacteria bacterium]|nr:hypothetical protein [Actinomycetota bacterium]